MDMLDALGTHLGSDCRPIPSLTTSGTGDTVAEHVQSFPPALIRAKERIDQHRFRRTGFLFNELEDVKYGHGVGQRDFALLKSLLKKPGCVDMLGEHRHHTAFAEAKLGDIQDASQHWFEIELAYKQGGLRHWQPLGKPEFIDTLEDYFGCKLPVAVGTQPSGWEGDQIGLLRTNRVDFVDIFVAIVHGLVDKAVYDLNLAGAPNLQHEAETVGIPYNIKANQGVLPMIVNHSVCC